MKKTFRLFLIVVSFISYLYLPAQQSDGVKFENIIAVYIYNFTKFLEWPNNDSEFFYISVLGKSKITESLYKIAEKEKVNGKKIIIEEIKALNYLKNNSVLFISTDDDNMLPVILKKTTEKNILTISNSQGFANKGVCINFFLVDDKMKFEINRKAIKEAGIIPNTRLLSLAVKVYE